MIGLAYHYPIHRPPHAQWDYVCSLLWIEGRVFDEALPFLLGGRAGAEVADIDGEERLSGRLA